MATVAERSRNSAGVSLKLGGVDPFLKLDTFDLYPDSHYPVNQVRDFFFFDIGEFAKNPNATTNFADEDGLSFTGEVKELSVAVVGLDTVHFDLMALVTDKDGCNIATTWEKNANYKDVTWNGSPVPEPATMLLLGTGLTGLAALRRKKNV